MGRWYYDGKQQDGPRPRCIWTPLPLLASHPTWELPNLKQLGPPVTWEFRAHQLAPNFEGIPGGVDELTLHLPKVGQYDDG